MKKSFAQIFKEIRNEKGWSQDVAAEKFDVSKSTVSMWENGKRFPEYKTLEKIADYVNYDIDYLLGRSEIKRKIFYKTGKDDIFQFKNIIPLKNVDIPVIGDIHCGTPHEAIENAKMKTFQFPEGFEIDFDFALKCLGDSMINDGIDENDFVFIKKQENVKNGEIAVVIIDDEATLKRFYYHKDNEMVILKAGNPAFEDQIYMGEKLNEIRIIGKVVKVLKNVQ